MTESIPVGLVRAQRFIAVHLITQAETPARTVAEEPILAVRAEVESAFRAANLAGTQASELSRALAYLAYNTTRCPSSRVGLDRFADWTFHLHKRSRRGLNPIPPTLLPKALDLWKQGVAIGVLSLTDESVDFRRTETRLFFCALFILAQPLDPAHLRWLSQPEFAAAWRAGAVLDPELPGRLAAILRGSRHQREPIWTARVLSYIGGTQVAQLFWTMLGGDPGTISDTPEYPSQNEQDEAAVILTRVRALFHHCLLRALRRGDGQAREYCGHLIHHLRLDKEIFGPEWNTFLPPELVPLLQDEQPEVRIEVGAILLVLNQHLQPMVGLSMLEILNHANPNVRWEAAMVMARAGGRRAVEPLLEAVKAGNHGQRHAAMRCLGDLGDPRAVPALIDVLRDPSDSLRAGAIYPLALLRDRRAVPALIRYAEETLAWESTGSLAIDALGWIGDDRAVDVCLRALSHKSGWVRGYAAEALGRLGSKRAVPALIQALRAEQGPHTRGNAASALGALGDPIAVEVLIEVLNGNTWAGRREAACSLGLLGGPRAVEALVSALESSSNEDSTSAAWSLARSGAMEARGPLLRAIESAIREEKRTVYSLMMDLAKLDREMAIPYLLQVLNDPSGRGHASAIEALGRLGDPRAIPALRYYEPPTGINTEWLQKSMRD
ncbi:MAG TPA: HEAT repeat domain-containing protein, partial [Chloroflexota bacterium]|nr:HEAT repeat domain-containing protein [Chloroflexota bacterium]